MFDKIIGFLGKCIMALACAVAGLFLIMLAKMICKLISIN